MFFIIFAGSQVCLDMLNYLQEMLPAGNEVGEGSIIFLMITSFGSALAFLAVLIQEVEDDAE